MRHCLKLLVFPGCQCCSYRKLWAGESVIKRYLTVLGKARNSPTVEVAEADQSLQTSKTYLSSHKAHRSINSISPSIASIWLHPPLLYLICGQSVSLAATQPGGGDSAALSVPFRIMDYEMDIEPTGPQVTVREVRSGHFKFLDN